MSATSRLFDHLVGKSEQLVGNRTDEVLANPRHPYTRALLSDPSARWAALNAHVDAE